MCLKVEIKNVFHLGKNLKFHYVNGFKECVLKDYTDVIYQDLVSESLWRNTFEFVLSETPTVVNEVWPLDIL